MPQPEEATRHVFVYGTLRRGARNDIARYRPSPRFVGTARVAGTLHDLGAYPGMVLGGAGLVSGEVYAITPAVEAELDVLEDVAPAGSGEYLKREVLVDAAGQSLRCLVYEIHPDRVRQQPVIGSGDWLAR